jgi:hypothetical protein
LVLANVIKVQPHEVQDFFVAAWLFHPKYTQIKSFIAFCQYLVVYFAA